MTQQPLLIAQYKVLLYSAAGELVAEFDNPRRIEMYRIVNGVGYCNITLSGFDSQVSLFEVNSILEIWRRTPGFTPSAVPPPRQKMGGWYVEWEGLVGDFTEQIYENGDRVFIARADTLLDLLKRRYILWYASAGASESKKVGIPAQTAIYEFVEENCGASATTALGRLLTGTITGLTIPADVGAGPNWFGARAYRSLLQVIQEIGNYGQIDFDVIGEGGNNFRFETYENQLGQDRTETNTAGNDAVIFSLDNENVAQMTYSTNRRRSANAVITTGKNQYAARSIGQYLNAAEIDANRINQREISRNAVTQDSVDELNTLAEEYGITLQPTENIKFTPLRTITTLYSVHFWFGDRLTTKFPKADGTIVSLDKRLLSLKITVSGDRNEEQFSDWNFETIPTVLR